jgi:hypothetical protein
VLLAVALALPAVAHAQREVVGFAPTSSVLLMIPGAQAAQLLGQNRPPGIDPASEQETELLRDCTHGEGQQVERGLISGVASQAWHILLHPLAVSVHRDLMKYASVSDAKSTVDYYRGGSGGSATTPLASRISCMRFTRFAISDSMTGDVALDFVASVRLDLTRDAILLRPLRLYINQAVARSADARYGVAIQILANAVWRDEYAGHESRVFDYTVTENVDLKSAAFLKYYPTDPAAGVRVPIIPVSFGSDRGRDFGRAEFEVSVAELGTPPATLQLLAALLPDPDEKFSRVVVAAAIAATGGTE